MKAKGLYVFTAVLFVLGMIVFFGCKKDNNSTDNSTVATSTVNEAQQSESQDAIADKTEQDMDNNLDKLESNGYSTSSEKSDLDECVSVSIDSTTRAKGWPRTVTLTYNCQDTINNEIFSQTGQIIVQVDTIKKTKSGMLYSRNISFNNYKIIMDSIPTFSPATSPSVTITGSRTLTRIGISRTIINSKLINIDVTDSITSDMNFTINYGDTTITFTRNVARERVAELYFKRITGTLIWLSDIPKDTLTYTGTVTGINARGKNYTREITTPLECTFCSSWPHNLRISSGVISFSNDGGLVGTITYSANTDDCKTTVTLNANGKTKVIERKFGRKFHKWW